MSSRNKQDKPKARTYADKRHDDRVRFAYFARYMMVRYIVIALFFANFFWVLLSYSEKSQLGLLLSAIGTIWSTVSVFEQLGKLHDHQPDVPKTRHYLTFQIAFNLTMIFGLLTPFRKQIYPFVTTQDAGLALICILLIGIVAAAVALLRIRNICLGKDKYLVLIHNAENSHALDQE